MKKVTDFELIEEGQVQATKIITDPSQYTFLNRFGGQVVQSEGTIVASAEDVKNKDSFGSFLASGYFKYSDGNMMNTNIGRHKIYLNLCSTNGKWESGNISEPVGERWTTAPLEFKRWYHSQYKFALGELQETVVQSDAMIINCLCFNEDEAISEQHFKSVLNKVAMLAKLYNSIIYTKCSYDWAIVEPTIIDTIVKSGITVVVFEPLMTE